MFVLLRVAYIRRPFRLLLGSDAESNQDAASLINRELTVQGYLSFRATFLATLCFCVLVGGPLSSGCCKVMAAEGAGVIASAVMKAGTRVFVLCILRLIYAN